MTRPPDVGGAAITRSIDERGHTQHTLLQPSSAASIHRSGRCRLFWSLELAPTDWRTKENGETGFPISPLRTHLQRVFVALAAGRGWPQSLAGPRVAGELRDPRPLPPSSGHDRSMRMDRSHRTPAPVSRQRSPLERGGGVSSKTISTRHSRGPSAAFATARHLTAPLSARPFPLIAEHPSFVRRTICLAAITFKRENQGPSVDWRDNED